jgi:hypothetical protein
LKGGLPKQNRSAPIGARGKEKSQKAEEGSALEHILKQDFGQLNEDRLYRNMDRLYGKRASIEAALCGKEIKLFSLKDSILLYDLTST